MRFLINNYKDRVIEYVDKSDPEAMRKVGHYIEALNDQLEVCNKTDEMIDKLG